MTDIRFVAALVYAVGVLWGLIVIDARPVPRVAIALCWPLGPLAFVLTVSLLLVVSPVALIGRR